MWHPRHGGAYWSVTADGLPLDRKKQIYAQAFAIDALAEQSRATLDPKPFRAAFELFALLELHARDPRFGGYLEARVHDWSETGETRLSSVDLVCEKSMNTNPHVLEAFTNLLRAAMLFAPDGRISEVPGCDRLASALSDQIRIIEQRVLQPNGHLGLFFSLDWSRLDQKISFGRDIEASWLLLEAREVADEYRRTVDGLDAAPDCSATVPGCRPAAEAQAALSTWDFARRHMLDHERGDWFWGVTGTGALLGTYPKGGKWKTGYHAGRACMEVIRRLDTASVP